MSVATHPAKFPINPEKSIKRERPNARCVRARDRNPNGRRYVTDHVISPRAPPRVYGENVGRDICLFTLCSLYRDMCFLQRKEWNVYEDIVFLTNCVQLEQVLLSRAAYLINLRKL